MVGGCYHYCTHSKFVSSPVICLFSTVNPSISLSFAFLYSDDIVVPTVEINRATHVNH